MMNSVQAPQQPNSEPQLHFLCGKIASGKSTLAKTLSQQPRTILLCEDE
ncbi:MULTISPECIES: ATP-binding protein [Providencia]|nr:MULTISPECIES: ATP-binding protein [Providencia]